MKCKREKESHPRKDEEVAGSEDHADDTGPEQQLGPACDISLTKSEFYATYVRDGPTYPKVRAMSSRAGARDARASRTR